MQRTASNLIALLEPHYSSALQYCRALYSNPKDAEDGMQDALINALRYFRTLSDEKKFRSWLFTIITRTFYHSRRKQVRIQRLFTPLRDHHQAVFEVYSDDDLGEREKIMLVALNTLTEKERTAILLFEIGELSLEEIRKVQSEKSISAIKSRLSRTRSKLRSIIMEMEETKHEQGGNYDIKTYITGK
jgi:RNA polymerase sigma-70 factor (ECF subfamily)